MKNGFTLHVQYQKEALKVSSLFCHPLGAVILL